MYRHPAEALSTGENHGRYRSRYRYPAHKRKRGKRNEKGAVRAVQGKELVGQERILPPAFPHAMRCHVPVVDHERRPRGHDQN